MEPAGDVGAGDQAEHGVVVAEPPGPEALAQVGVEVDGCHDRQPRWQAGGVNRRRDDVLITATELARLLAAGEPVTVLDVRWQLTEPDGRAAYERGHIPGAVYVSLEDELSDHTVAGRGRHPLPSGRAVEAAARRWGVREGGPVVVYDDWNRAGSARAWWVLTAAGMQDVRILDGGLGRVDRRRWCAGERNRHARARRCDGAPRRPVRRCTPDFDGRAGDGGGNPARRAGTRAVPRRRRADRSGGRTHSRSPQRAEHRLVGRRRNVSRRRRSHPAVRRRRRRRAPTAAPASPRRWSSPRSLRSASTPRCIPARGPNGVRTQRVPSKGIRAPPADLSPPMGPCRTHRVPRSTRRGP